MLAEAPCAAPPAVVAPQEPVMAPHRAELERAPAGELGAPHLPPSEPGADLVDRVPAQQLGERGDLLPAGPAIELRGAIDVVRGAAVRRCPWRDRHAQAGPGNPERRALLEAALDGRD